MRLLVFCLIIGLLKVQFGNIKYLLFLGVAINTAILVVLILSIFSKRLINSLVEFIYKILEKMHYKKAEEFRNKCFEQIKEYKKGAKLLLENKKVLLKIVSTTIIQVTLYHSIPYIIYLSLGLTNANFLQFLALQSVLYISVSGLPLPGAVGVSEGGFLAIYKFLFPTAFLSSAMLLSRGISFYLFVIISGISVLCFSFRKDKNK